MTLQSPIRFLFRYRDLVAKTLDEHRAVLQANPAKGCWWGWWKRPHEDARQEVWDAIRAAIVASPQGRTRIGLFDSGAPNNVAVHPVWIDNRDGVAQMWTTKIRVDGRAVANGDASLSSLTDVTGRVALELINMSYDKQSSTVTGYAYVRNESTDTIEGPIKARVVELTSAVGTPAIVSGVENRMTGPGAVFDFTPLTSSGRLMPGAQTAPLKISIRLANPKSLAPEGRGAPTTTFVYLRTKVLAGKASG